MIDPAVEAYIAAVPAEHRALFDRVHRLVLDARPDAEVVISYGIPTYKAGRRRLHVGVWKHGLSIYGWGEGEDAGLTTRHPHLKTGKGTIRLRPADAADIDDEELRALARAALAE